MLKIAVEQLIWNVRVYVQHWAVYDVISGERGKMTHLMKVPSTIEISVCANGEKFRENVCNEVRAVRDCCISQTDL